MKTKLTLLLGFILISIMCLNAQKRDALKLFESNGKYGFKDSVTGTIVIQAKYESALDFYKGIASVGLNGKQGFIDKNENIVVPFKYDFIFSFQDDRAWVLINNKYGYVDTTGKEVIPLIYDKAYGFHDGLGCVKKGNKWGFVNNAGKIIIPLKYDKIEQIFHEGLAAFNIGGDGGKWGYIDKNGNEIIPPIYDKANSFGSLRKDFAYVAIGEDKFWINKKGERLK